MVAKKPNPFLKSKKKVVGKKKANPFFEKATGEKYPSKAAMKKHEAGESKVEQKKEQKLPGGLMFGKKKK